MITMIMLVIATAGVTEVQVAKYQDYATCVSDASTFNQGVGLLKLQNGPTLNFQCKEMN